MREMEGGREGGKEGRRGEGEEIERGGEGEGERERGGGCSEIIVQVSMVDCD